MGITGCSESEKQTFWNGVFIDVPTIPKGVLFGASQGLLVFLVI